MPPERGVMKAQLPERKAGVVLSRFRKSLKKRVARSLLNPPFEGLTSTSSRPPRWNPKSDRERFRRLRANKSAPMTRTRQTAIWATTTLRASQARRPPEEPRLDSFITDPGSTLVGATPAEGRNTGP